MGKTESQRVGVQMAARCYRVLKQYAARFDLSMGEVMYHFTRKGMHEHAQVCNVIEGLLLGEQIPLDSRAHKACWGIHCMSCEHRVPCASHEYTGTWEYNVERFGSWAAIAKVPIPAFGHDRMQQGIELLRIHAPRGKGLLKKLSEGDVDAVLDLFRMGDLIPFIEIDIGTSEFVYSSKAWRPIFGIDESFPLDQLNPMIISPEVQPNGGLTTEEVPKRIAHAVEQGLNCFEWLHCSLDGGIFFACEVTLATFNGRLYGGLTRIDEPYLAQEEE